LLQITSAKISPSLPHFVNNDNGLVVFLFMRGRLGFLNRLLVVILPALIMILKHRVSIIVVAYAELAIDLEVDGPVKLLFPAFENTFYNFFPRFFVIIQILVEFLLLLYRLLILPKTPLYRRHL
jgi:hypothetical protein